MSRKVAVLRAATRNLKAKKRPLPHLQVRQGDKSEYLAKKNRYHPHLDLIMAQAVLSPYNGDFDDPVFNDIQGTGWKGYSQKQLQTMEEVIESRLKLLWIREEVKPVRPKPYKYPPPVYDMANDRIVAVGKIPKEQAVIRKKLPDYFSKRPKFKQHLKEKFSEVCEYNSPFYRVQRLVKYKLNDLRIDQ